MKWRGSRESDNVEDRRSVSGGKIAVGGGVIGIIILLLNIFGGENAKMITPVLEQMQGGQTQTEAAAPLSKEDEEMGHFVRSVLAKTEDTWGKIFAENGMTYKKPKLVLFKGSVQTACGGASSASGPFYCPADQKVYMDLGFLKNSKQDLVQKAEILRLLMLLLMKLDIMFRLY